MATGTVTFHNETVVRRHLVREKDNAIVRRLEKTKEEVQVDHEAVRQERQRQQGREKKARATEEVSRVRDAMTLACRVPWVWQRS